jgi:ABC-2 type transport system permease protein
MSGALTRVRAIARKETAQMLRDPATILIAFVLPVVLLVLFATAVSLDIRKLPVAVVLETDSASAQDLAAAFAAAPSLAVTPMRDRRSAQVALVAGRIKGFAVIPADFEARIAAGTARTGPLVEIVTDASQPNTAVFAANF